MNLTIHKATTGRALLPDELFGRLAARLAQDHPDLASDMPARIMDQALAFLGTCATTTEALGPSDLVDIGWHTFILHTYDYAQFCQRIAGRFIHHQPQPGPGDPRPSTPEPIGSPISRTVAAITAAGYVVDPLLWVRSGPKCQSKCHQCHAGCYDSPTR